MEARRVVVTRDVGDEPHNFAERDVKKGEVLYECSLATFGACDTQYEIPLTEQPDEYPFFGFPRDAVEYVP